MSRFCTATDIGPTGQPEPCPARALPGQSFCYSHHPNPTAYPRCEFFNRLGCQCGAIAIRGHNHCFTHSPRNHRATQPAIPLIPRTRRQKAAARRILLSHMPQLETVLLEAARREQHATHS